MRKKKTTPSSLEWNFEDFKWCIENDFQVYIVVHEFDFFKIAVRRGGITSEGKDVHKDEMGRIFKSKVTLSDLTFKTQAEAENHLNYTYKYLRNKYG